MTARKLFGEFLVEKGVVNQELLLDALLEQLRSMQSLPEFAFRQGQLTPAQILAAFRVQHLESLDFPAALRKAGEVPADKVDQLLEAYSASRLPIGELLVKRGVPLEQIIRSFDEFLSDHVTAGPAPAAAPTAAAPPPSAAPDPARSPVIQEYLELSGGSQKRDEILGQLAVLNSTGVALTKEAQVTLVECVKSLHLLLGAARFLKLERSEALLREIEVALLKALKGKTAMRVGLGQELHDALAGAVRQVWEYRDALAASGQETGLETGPLVSIIQKLCGELPAPPAEAAG